MDVNMTSVRRKDKKWIMNKLLTFWVLILNTLILKIATIFCKTNDLLECVAKLLKIHKLKLEKIKANDQAWRAIKD